MQKISSNTMEKQNNVDFFQSILCFARLFMNLVLQWFFYCRMRLFWAGNKFWCTCYRKVNLEIEVEIIQQYFLVCRLVKMRPLANIFQSFSVTRFRYFLWNKFLLCCQVNLIEKEIGYIKKTVFMRAFYLKK